MIEKLLKDAMALVIGKQGEEIVNLLYSKKHVNEFLIAKKLNLTINQTRNILYKLLDSGLISSIRKKDKKKGWYTYFWRIEVIKSLMFLRDAVSKRIEQLEHFIKSREKKQFYTCERCNVEYTEENALLHNFTCEECGGIFNLKDNTKLVNDLKKEIEKVKKQKELIEQEIQIERDKLEKVRQKEMKKEEKEKSEARKKASKKRREEKEKNKPKKISMAKSKTKRIVHKIKSKKIQKIYAKKKVKSKRK